MSTEYLWIPAGSVPTVALLLTHLWLLEAVGATRRRGCALGEEARIADLAVGVTVMEGYFGWEAGSFVEVYAAKRQQAGETLLADEPIADAIEELLEGDRGSAWSGTATQLQEMLAFYVKFGQEGRRLKRIAPALRAAGIEYTENELGHRKTKVKTLRMFVRDDEEAQDSGKEAREDQADPDDEAVGGEEEHDGEGVRIVHYVDA